jgi:hypothetical protein
MTATVPAGFFIRTPQTIAVAEAASIGVSAGACGAVTQGTSKTTGVTLSTKAGVITMHAAALASVTAVKFTQTNTACSATDVVICNQGGGGTAGAYSVEACAQDGSIAYRVENNTAGPLSEALTINFIVIDSQAG